MAITPRRVVGDASRWKAMSHPLRREMLRHLDEHGPATSTTLAGALGENTGTTSYHLRVLADAGVIEEVPERANGRERWWRTFPVDHREPDYDSAQRRRTGPRWTSGAPSRSRASSSWSTASSGRSASTASGRRPPGPAVSTPSGTWRPCTRSTSRCCTSTGTPRRTPPPGARPMQLRMFYIPDE